MDRTPKPYFWTKRIILYSLTSYELLANVQGIHQGVAVYNIAVKNIVKQHIHLAQTPHRPAFFLSVKRNVSGRTIAAFHIVFAFDEPRQNL